MQRLLSKEAGVTSVTTATSGEEGLELITENKYDLLLTDLKMNHMSGIELIQAIKNKGIKNLISIVITGYGTIHSAIEAIKTGAFDYLVKPFELSDLRNKIKEVESEIKLRKSLSTLRVEKSSSVGDFDDKIDIRDFDEPYLVISTRDPKEILREYDLNGAKTIQLGFSPSNDMLSPTKLHTLRSQIKTFVKKSKKGTILFEGLDELLKTHSWDYFKSFILNLRNEILSSDFSMVFFLGQLNQEEAYYQPLIHDALSLLSVQAFDDIVGIISHPLRKGIINLLRTEEPMNFNRIGEELSIESSSGLAFHTKKLITEKILEKQGNQYVLSSRGKYIGEIIYILEKIGLADPSSRVKVIRTP
jgi:CheY-like chemotaxis protein